MEMQVIKPVKLRSKGGARGLNGVLANRQVWKNAIYSIALITYLCSFLFFGLAIADVRESGGTMTALIDLIVALYFLVQVSSNVAARTSRSTSRIGEARAP